MIIIERRAPLDAMRATEQLPGSAFTNESGGHRFVITAVRANEPVVLDGSVSALFIKPDRTGVQLTSSYCGIDDGGHAWAQLPANCYEQTGAFGLVITHIEANGCRSVLYSAVGVIRTGDTAQTVDPANVINVTAILAYISDMESATAAATAAAAFVPGMLARTFSASSVYSAGEYVVNDDDGKLYRITAAHAKNVTWANTSKEEVMTVDEISRAFSGIDELQSLNSGEIIPLVRGGYINTNPGTSTPVDITPAESGAWQCAVVDCAENDTFTITGDTSGSNTNHYLWLFLKSDYTRLTHATAGDVEKDLVLTAPENAAYLVFNAKMGYPAFLCRGSSVQKQITDLETSVTDMGTSVTGLESSVTDLEASVTDLETSVTALEPSLRYRSTLTAAMDIHDLESGLYRKLTAASPVNWPASFPDGMASNSGLLAAFKWGSAYRALLYFPAKTTNRPNSAIFFQMTANAAWTEWRMLNTNLSGDSTDLNEIISQYKNASGKFDTSFSVSFGINRETKVIGMVASYTGDAPSIVYTIDDGSTGIRYTSPAYNFGSTVQPVKREWRIPPEVDVYNNCTVTVTVPSGTVVDISDMYLRDDHLCRGGTDGIFWQGHSGFPSLIPRDTIESYQMAARLGFPAIIAIPHFTSDGVAVCIHTDNAVSNDLCMPDGTAISGAGSVGDYTYADLLQFDVKLKTSGGYSASGMKVPTLDEFFRICANSGMIPILSIHTIGQFGYNDTTTGVANFRKVREIAEKYGLLSRLMLKSLGNYDVQNSEYTVFGKEIGGYILLRIKTSTWSPLANARDSLLSLTDSSDRLLPTTVASGKESPVPLIFELYSDASNRDAGIAKGIEQGFRVSVAHDSTTPMSGATMTGLIEAGVTSFCQDHHCSNGLNWW